MKVLDWIKKLLFWPLIRKRMIIREHRIAAKYCRELISRYYQKKPVFNLAPKKVLPDKKIIWQYWGQGFDDRHMPPLVRLCLDSVERYCDKEEYEIIRLSDKDISDYIDLPVGIAEKYKDTHRAFFSDLLRCCLLTVYGGAWLDATVLLTDKIPERYWKQEFFMFQRDDTEANKDYWENAFSYYYGWNKRFRVNVLSSIFFSKKSNPLILDLRNILLLFCTLNEKLPNYFFFQILFNELLDVKYAQSNCMLESDCVPHYLQQIINDEHFKIASFEEALNLTSIHKLTYKSEGGYERLISLIEKYGCKI